MPRKVTQKKEANVIASLIFAAGLVRNADEAALSSRSELLNTALVLNPSSEASERKDDVIQWFNYLRFGLFIAGRCHPGQLEVPLL